ncbi:MAG: DegV family protein [Clostridia bacterium]|nr:DegV family protein [Clostridia bacterium]
MKDYIVYTDSACDIDPKILAEWGVGYSSLTFRFDDSEKEYSNDDMAAPEFYEKMKKGGIAKTAAINVETFAAAFEPFLKDGKDVLYLGFSSGLSTTFNSARLAAAQLSERHTDNKVVAVDTLSASAGFGLLLYLVLEKKKAGADIDEAAAYANDLKFRLCHWFTVDDLVYLKRGGRISPTLAFVGNALGIKPVLHMDNEGHLINVSKVRGRKSSIAALADKYGELALDPAGGTVFISHGDCQKDVDELSELLSSRYGAKVQLVTYVGPVIGAHAGPGVIALFFEGKER